MSQKRRRHLQLPLGPRRPSIEKILEQATALFEAGRPEEALRMLEDAPAHFQRMPEVLLLKGFILTATGLAYEALPLLEEAHQQVPDNPIIALTLSYVYAELNMLVHKLRTLRPFVRQLEMIPEPDLIQEVHTSIAIAEELVQREAEILGIPREKVEEAMYQLERAIRFARTDDFPKVFQALHHASQLAPDWILPKGLEMEILFRAGRVPEAIRLAEQLQARYPDDLYITLCLAHYSIGMGDRQRAEDLVRPIRSARIPNVHILEKAIVVFGLLEDDQALYDLYQKYKKMLREMESVLPFIALGSAAANLGDSRTARRLWKRAMDIGELSYSDVETLFQAVRRGAPGPGLCARYPTHFPVWILPIPVVNEYQELTDRWAEGEIGERQFRKRLRSLVDRSPRILEFVVRDFQEAQQPVAMAEFLSTLGTPEALETLRRFIFGQGGGFADRMRAAQILVEAGVLDPLVELWEENRQEWRPFIIPPRDWKEEPTRRTGPRAYPLVQQGLQEAKRGELEKALESIQQAIALEPNNPDHYERLGTVYQTMGDNENAQRYFQKAIEMDPLHVLARSSLAAIALANGDKAGARRQLEAVARKRPFDRGEFTVYMHILGVLGLIDGDLAYASFCAERGREAGMGDEMFDLLEREIYAAEMTTYLEEVRRWRRQREEQKRRQPIAADASLPECLGRLTKETLAGMARELRLSYNIRKALLIQQITEKLTDPAILKQRVQHLSDQERQALRDVLEAGGILSWDEFVSRYDQDLDERHWIYEKPKTVMGRLRLFGFISAGTVDGNFVVLIPRELRPLLSEALADA